jgi:hypothetical protein
MKIFLSFLQDTGGEPHDIPAYRFWTYYIKNGIEEAAMHWTEVPGLDWAAGLIPYENDTALNLWKEQAWEKTLKYIKSNRHNIDIFLSYLYPKQIEINAIKEIRKLGIPCINFYCDHIRQYTKLPDEFKVFDMLWVPEFEAIPMYKKAKIDFINLPMPMWVKPQYRRCPVIENSIISFIGSKDILRQNLLSQVINKGLFVEIRGNGWKNEDAEQKNVVIPTAGWSNKLINQMNFAKRFGLKSLIIKYAQQLGGISQFAIPDQNLFQKPDFENYIRITRQCSVTIGINRVPTFKALNTQPLVYSRLRDIEAPMMGACYLTEYTEGLNNLYHLGKEIETYTNADELIYKCNELINSPAKRKELRIHGQKKALDFHAIPSSLQKLKVKLF